ncbi:MAG TPA: sialidase family protein [Nocardioides sp.]
MTLPTDLQHQVAQRAEQPGFDEVLARASAARRRRRTTIASGLAAAVVVAGVVALPALLPSGHDRSAPQPASPGLTDDRLPADVRDLLGQQEVYPWTVAGSGDGVAVLWRSCPGEGLDQPCSFALTTRRGDDVSGTAVAGDHPRLTSVPSGWLLETDGVFDVVLAGGDRPVVDSGPGSADVMAGDTVVETDDGFRLLRGTKVVPAPAPADSELWAAYVTPDGRLVAVTARGSEVAVSATDDGRTWESDVLPREEAPVAALVAGSGDHVAVALIGEDSGTDYDGLPVLDVQVSDDGGRTWIPARGLDTRGADGVGNASSLAVTPSGTTYLTTETHGLVRIDAAGNAMPARLSSHDTSAIVLDDTVCVVAEAGKVDELQCSADDGATWAAQPLPGFD